jgi:hypothetical protein
VSIITLWKFQAAVSAGAFLQCQFDSRSQSTLSAGPFIMVLPQFWIRNRISIGPLLQWNYLAHGMLFSQSIPTHRACVLPQGANWFDGGMVVGFHF